MPVLWDDTIEAHRHAVAHAIMDRTAELASAEGLHALSMARIAQETGIGRATLYKYFGDVEQILAAWHQRQVEQHLQRLENLRVNMEDPLAALEQVLLTFANNSQRGHHHALASFLHTLPHVGRAHAELHVVVTKLIREALVSDLLDSQAPAEEMARFALTAIGAQTSSKPALKRLVRTILRGLGAGLAAP